MVVAFTIRRMTDGRQHYNAVTVAADQKGTPAVSPRDTPIAAERATSANTGVSSFVRQALGRVNADAVSNPQEVVLTDKRHEDAAFSTGAGVVNRSKSELFAGTAGLLSPGLSKNR